MEMLWVWLLIVSLALTLGYNVVLAFLVTPVVFSILEIEMAKNLSERLYRRYTLVGLTFTIIMLVAWAMLCFRFGWWDFWMSVGLLLLAVALIGYGFLSGAILVWAPNLKRRMDEAPDHDLRTRISHMLVDLHTKVRLTNRLLAVVFMVCAVILAWVITRPT